MHGVSLSVLRRCQDRIRQLSHLRNQLLSRNHLLPILLRLLLYLLRRHSRNLLLRRLHSPHLLRLHFQHRLLHLSVHQLLHLSQFRSRHRNRLQRQHRHLCLLLPQRQNRQHHSLSARRLRSRLLPLPRHPRHHSEHRAHLHQPILLLCRNQQLVEPVNPKSYLLCLKTSPPHLVVHRLPAGGPRAHQADFLQLCRPMVRHRRQHRRLLLQPHPHLLQKINRMVFSILTIRRWTIFSPKILASRRWLSLSAAPANSKCPHKRSLRNKHLLHHSRSRRCRNLVRRLPWPHRLRRRSITLRRCRHNRSECPSQAWPPHRSALRLPHQCLLLKHLRHLLLSEPRRHSRSAPSRKLLSMDSSKLLHHLVLHSKGSLQPHRLKLLKLHSKELGSSV